MKKYKDFVNEFLLYISRKMKKIHNETLVLDFIQEIVCADIGMEIET